jgi:hypothetical protein
MKKIAILAAVAAMSIGFIPGHADPANRCLATDDGVPGAQGNVALTCTYTAGAAAGLLTQATPNKITVVEVDANNNATELYSQPSLTAPGTASYSQTPGRKIVVTVGWDDAEGFVQGSVGLVTAGDAS